MTTKGLIASSFLEKPGHALLLLFTDSGPTLWMNHVLLFGGTGAVWEVWSRQ